MRSFDFLRSAVLAASLIAALGSVGTAFANPMQTNDGQQAQQPSYTSPYDSPDFVVPENNING
jgi:hypothetical protein